jgi:hypothetical protein
VITELLKLIDQRDQAFERATDIIASRIDFVYEAIIEFLDESIENIIWDSVEVNSSNMIVIIAHVVDSSILNDHGIPETRLLTIGIPFEIVDSESKATVVHFLRRMDQIRKSTSKNSVSALNKTLSDLAEGTDSDSDLDIIFGENERINQRLLDMLRDEGIDIDDGDDVLSNPRISSYTKRTLH